MKSATEISIWLQEKIAGEMECEPSEIATDTEFSSLGLDSLLSVSLADELGSALSCELDPTVFWEFPTIGELSRWLANDKLKN